MIDLRKFHITNDKELIAFLELVEARVPEIIRTVKKMQMRNASLENVVRHQQSQKVQAVPSITNAPNSVSEATKPIQSESNEVSERLAQMREASANAEKKFGSHPKKVEAGQIGQLVEEIKEQPVESLGELQEDLDAAVKEVVEDTTKANVEVKDETPEAEKVEVKKTTKRPQGLKKNATKKK